MERRKRDAVTPPSYVPRWTEAGRLGYSSGRRKLRRRPRRKPPAMPMQPKPRWHKTAKLWFANIGPKDKNGRRTEAYAPATIKEKDEGAAWKWFHEERTRQDVAETPVTPKTITVKDLGDLYLAFASEQTAKGRISPEHYRSKDVHIRHLAANLGHRVAASLTPHDIEEFIERLEDAGFLPNYVSNICSTVAAAFNWGKRKNHWPESPVRGFKVPVVPKAPERYATKEEAALWLRFLWRRTRRNLVASRYDRIHVLMQRMLIRTGARPKELCVLLWSDIRWDSWTTPNGHLGSKAIIPASRWKSGEATGESRLVLISPAHGRALRRLRDDPASHPEYVFTHGRGRGGKGAGDPWKDGSTVSKTICRLRRELIAIQAPIFEKAKDKAPLSDEERRLARVRILDDGDNRLVNYRWRHTAASYLLMRGVDVATVAGVLGTSPEMIYRNYGHLISDHLEKAAYNLMTNRKA